MHASKCACMCVCMSVHALTHACQHTLVHEEAKHRVRFPGTGVPASCEPPNVGAGSWNQVLSNSNVCSQWLRHLSNPIFSYLAALDWTSTTMTKQWLGERPLNYSCFPLTLCFRLFACLFVVQLHIPGPVWEVTGQLLRIHALLPRSFTVCA